ncbi:YbjQ family protein [Halorubrum sp. AS12]|uniref:YbjQ family protein n=1 Tax=Halorubrum sp. AS12 TaxID=3409687 RepID=UPI003DA6E81B
MSTSTETQSLNVEVVTTETVANQDIQEVLGIARGNTVKARNVGRDITQWFRNITGGELKAYSELLTDARDEALSRMASDAESMGADAVVNVRLESSKIANSGSEVIAYGTAVRLA